MAQQLFTFCPTTKCKSLHDFPSQHKLLQKLEFLFQLASSPLTPKVLLQQALESFDCVKMEGMKHAEKHCCCFNMGTAQFSLELNLWHQWHLLWKLVIQCQAGFPIKVCYICCLAHSCNIFNPLSLSPQQAWAAYHAADHIYSSLKPNHALLHSKFLASHLINPSLSDEHHKVIACLFSLEAGGVTLVLKLL